MRISVNFRFEEKLLKEAKAFAEENGKTLTGVVREALILYMETYSEYREDIE